MRSERGLIKFVELFAVDLEKNTVGFEKKVVSIIRTKFALIKFALGILLVLLVLTVKCGITTTEVTDTSEVSEAIDSGGQVGVNKQDLALKGSESDVPRNTEVGEWLPVFHDSEAWYLYSIPERTSVDKEAGEITDYLQIKKGERGAKSVIIFFVRADEDILWATGSDPDNWRTLDPGTLPQEIFKSWYEYRTGESLESIEIPSDDQTYNQPKASITENATRLVATPIPDGSAGWNNPPSSSTKASKSTVESINLEAQASSLWYWDQETGRTWLMLDLPESKMQKIVGMRFRITVFEDSIQENESPTPKSSSMQTSTSVDNEAMLEPYQDLLGPESNLRVSLTNQGLKEIIREKLADETSSEIDEQFDQMRKQDVYLFELHGLPDRGSPIFVELEGLRVTHGGHGIEIIDVLMDDSVNATHPEKHP